MMGKPSAVDTLREQIRLLELQHEEEGRQLKVHYALLVESLRPAQLFRSAVNDYFATPENRSGLMNSFFSLALALISRHMMTRSGAGLLTKFLTLGVQYGFPQFFSVFSERILAYFSEIAQDFLGSCSRNEQGSDV